MRESIIILLGLFAVFSVLAIFGGANVSSSESRKEEQRKEGDLYELETGIEGGTS